MPIQSLDNPNDSHVHRYAVGDAVIFNTAHRYQTTNEGTYEVISRMPVRDGQLQYRVRNALDRQERVVSEEEIDSVAGANP